MALKLLIIGKGFLGSSIYSAARKFDILPIGTNYSNGEIRLDITNIDQVDKIVSDQKPDFIINCAAITNIDEIEKNPREAYQINSYGARNVAVIAKKYGIRMIYVSTDSVFDGMRGMYDEKEIPSPVNEYARSKKMGEDLISDISNDFIITRTNFYGYNKSGKFLFNWILDNLRKGQNFTAFDDIIFNPLEVGNLSDLLIELIQTSYSGVLHLSSDNVLSKYQFAKKIANNLGFNEALVIKGSIRDASLIAKRPLNTSLSNQKAKKILKTNISSLEDWLKKNTFLNT